MSLTTTDASDSDVQNLDNYFCNGVGFQMWLHDLADALFPFPGYREGQGEALYEALESLYINGYDNVILDLPTGVGKSPLNVTLAKVTSHLASNRRTIENHFNVSLSVESGRSFYTTPQKQLRNQLAEDEDLEEYVEMLKARQDYICGESNEPCDSCPVKKDPEQSCMETAGCTYWSQKMKARQADIAVLTFAMLIVDYNIPPKTEGGKPLSFRNRDLVIVDEGHNLENQAASLFAGFSVSPWSVPEEVFGNAGGRANWDDDRFEDVEEILRDVNHRARNYIRKHEDDESKESRVEQCENFLRKLEYCEQEIKNDRPWVANVDKVTDRDGDETKKIELKPVFVDDFLSKFIWSRGKKRVISSATIPYRNNIGEWCDRIGLPGNTKLISKSMPFPESHRTIHANTIVGSMSGDDEDANWRDAMAELKSIHERHPGENGLVHTNSYDRAKRVQESLGDDLVMLQPEDMDKEQVIEKWCDSDQDILVSPSMVEGVDLYEDRCRWQALLKTPYPFVGDSRVSYLLNERNDWTWYMETASMDIQQSVGRAVRGPEPEEAASYYVIDSGFNKVVHQRTDPPKWFVSAIRGNAPDHWEDPEAAPWR